jgi:ribose transport system substrate-binding protein
VKQLEDGLVQALIAQSPYQIGVEGIDAIAKALQGQGVDHKVITGTVTITKDNLHAPETKKGLYLDKC